jgi:L-amino acid N-acyltransferase
MPDIRDAHEADLGGILAIHNEVLATSTAIYQDDPATLDHRREWWAQRVARGFPVLVACDGQGVAGFASFGEFRARPGYRFTVEHTVHVRADSRGRGIGGALMAELLQRAVAMNTHVMIGGIDAENTASLRFHERLGFTPAARLREVGFKFNRWLDLVLVQRIL